MKLWERLAKWSRQLVAAAVAPHGVPRHVAFIMDGNRRFAERQHLRRIEGHAAGYQRLLAALEWCLELGVECVSVYAFSIDNYKRSTAEVDLLMGLAEQKLGTMLEEQDVLVRHGVQVRVIGDLSLAPHQVQQAAAKVMAATQRHTKAVLNICFSYTASQEMLQALDRATLASTCACDGPCLAPSSSNSSSSGNAGSLLDPYLLTQGCPPVDLLIRTSGETRLSDFLLWQSRHALLVFTPVLWPDFGFLDLLSALVEYQRCKPAMDRARGAAELAVQRAGAGAGGHSSSSKIVDGRQQQQQLLQTGPGSGPYQEWEQDFAACRPAGQVPGLQQLLALSVLADGSLQNARALENTLPYQQQQQREEARLPGDIQPLGAGLGTSLGYAVATPAFDTAAAAVAGALDYRGQADSLLGSSSDGIAVVKVVHLGAESPWGGSSRSPSPTGVALPAEVASSPSGAASPQKILTPRWEGSLTRLLQVRTPSCGSLLGSSPAGKCLGSVRSGGLGGFRSAGSLRLGGSVDSFTSIELGEQQRRLSSYQDLFGLDS